MSVGLAGVTVDANFDHLGRPHVDLGQGLDGQHNNYQIMPVETSHRWSSLLFPLVTSGETQPGAYLFLMVFAPGWPVHKVTNFLSASYLLFFWALRSWS